MQAKSNQPSFWKVSKENEVKIHQPPLIILGCNPYEPFYHGTLLSLLPYLTERGYANFGYEDDHLLNLESLITRVKKFLEQAYKCKEIMRGDQWSLFNPSQQDDVKDMVFKRIPIFEKMLKLLEAVKERGWTYQGLDIHPPEVGKKLELLEAAYQGSLDENSRKIFRHRDDTSHEERVKTLAKNIVQLRQNVTGGIINLVSLCHCVSVSGLLYQSLGKEASKNILLLYVVAADDPDISQTQKIIEVLAKKYEQQGISFNCELIVSDEHSLKNIKKLIEANIKSIAIKKIDSSGELEKMEKQRQGAIQEATEELAELQKFQTFKNNI